MIVGSFGNITFRTSSFDVRTFKHLARKRSYAFSEHEVVSGKPYLQFGHENLETISFDMVLDRGLNPLSHDCRECRDLLDDMAKIIDILFFAITCFLVCMQNNYKNFRLFLEFYFYLCYEGLRYLCFEGKIYAPSCCKN